MLGFKEKYLSLSIHRQIQVGVGGVSICICCLVILLLLLNIFILIEITYSDTKAFFERRDNEQIQLVSLYVDTKLNIMIEKNKLSLQTVRNFIQNFKRNPQFLKQFVNLEVNKYMKRVASNNIPLCAEGKANCFFYKFLEKDYSIDPNFVTHLKILSVTLPLIKSVFKKRYYELTSTPFFLNIQLLSNVFKTIFYYGPTTEINDKYEYINLLKQSTFYIKYMSETLFTVTKDLNKNISDKTNTTILNNPFLSTLTVLDPYTLTYKDAFKNTPSLISVTSSLYNQNAEITTRENLENLGNLIDIVLGDIAPNVIDTYALVSIEKFKGITLIITNNADKVVSSSSCHYLNKFWQVLTGDLSYNKGKYKTMINPQDCLNYPANNTFDSYFNDKSISLSMKRRVRMVLAENVNNISMKFKVLQLNSPDTSTIILLDSNLLHNLKVYIYIFKNQEYYTKKIDKLYLLFLGGVLFMLLLNLGIWFIILLITTFLLYRVSKSISQPISELVIQVTSIGQDNKNDKAPGKNNALDNISFPDDKDIDDLFQICKILIKGGFTDENNTQNNNRNRRLKAVQYAYNNISIIKTNNLIIQEDKIENDVSSREYAVFHYRKSNEVDHEDLILFRKNSNIENTGETRLQTKNEEDLHSLTEEGVPDILLNSNNRRGRNVIDEEVLDIIRKEEEGLLGEKNYLYNILMDNTIEGREVELITI